MFWIRGRRPDVQGEHRGYECLRLRVGCCEMRRCRQLFGRSSIGTRGLYMLAWYTVCNVVRLVLLWGGLEMRAITDIYDHSNAVIHVPRMLFPWEDFYIHYLRVSEKAFICYPYSLSTCRSRGYCIAAYMIFTVCGWSIFLANTYLHHLQSRLQALLSD